MQTVLRKSGKVKCVKDRWTWHKNFWNEVNLSKLCEFKSIEENLVK
jgi:hypothetical protein